MPAVGGFQQAGSCYGGDGSSVRSGGCEDAAASDAAALPHVLRSASSNGRSSIAALQHFLQAAGNAVGLPSPYGNMITFSRSRGRSRTCDEVLRAHHALQDGEAGLYAPHEEGSAVRAAHGAVSEEKYNVQAGALASAEGLRRVRFTGVREGEAAASDRHVYRSREAYLLERHAYWGGGETTAVGGAGCMPSSRVSDLSQQRYDEYAERELFDAGHGGMMGGPRFNTAGEGGGGMAVGGTLGLTEYASGQVTLSLDNITSAAAYVGGSYPCCILPPGISGRGPGAGAVGHTSGCCAQNAVGTPHAGSNAWAPPSDIFSKGEYATVPDAQTSMSAAQSSQPSGGCWCSSRAAAAKASAAAAEAARNQGFMKKGESQSQDEENGGEDEDETRTPVAASCYVAAAHLRNKQQLEQQRQRVAAERLLHMREGVGRAAYRRHSAVSYYAGIFAAAAAASGHVTGSSEEASNSLRAAAQQHSPPDNLAYTGRAHSAAASAPTQTSASAVQVSNSSRGGKGGGRGAQILPEERHRSLSLGYPPCITRPEGAHSVQSSDGQRLFQQRVARDQLLLHQQKAREQLLQQHRARDYQNMHEQLQETTAEHQVQQQFNTFLSNQHMLQQQMKEYQLQNHATVDFWKSTVGTPSGACQALRNQKQHLLMLHEQLMQHRRGASSQQQQQQQSQNRFENRQKSVDYIHRTGSGDCNCSPYESCGYCRKRVPHVLHENDEEGEEQENKESAAAVAEYESMCAQQHGVLCSQPTISLSSPGTGEVRACRTPEEEQGQGRQEAAEEREEEHETADIPEKEAAARTGELYHQSPTAMINSCTVIKSTLHQQQSSPPLRDERNAAAAKASEDAASRLFISPYKLSFAAVSTFHSLTVRCCCIFCFHLLLLLLPRIRFAAASVIVIKLCTREDILMLKECGNMLVHNITAAAFLNICRESAAATTTRLREAVYCNSARFASEAKAAAAAVASTFSLTRRPRSGFAGHSPSYSSFDGGKSSFTLQQQQQHIHDDEEEARKEQDSLVMYTQKTSQELQNEIQQEAAQQTFLHRPGARQDERPQRQAGLQQTRTPVQCFRGKASTVRNPVSDVCVGAEEESYDVKRAAEAAEDAREGSALLQCSAGAAPAAAWPCTTNDSPPSSSLLRAPTALAGSSSALKRNAASSVRSSAVEGTAASSKKSALWAPSSLLKTLTRGLQQHTVPSTSSRRSSSTLISTTAAAAPLSAFSSSSSCTRRLSVLSSNGVAAPAGSAAGPVNTSQDTDPGRTDDSSTSNRPQAATVLQERDTRPPPLPRAGFAAPLTRSYSASLYRGSAATTDTSQGSSGCSKAQQSDSNSSSGGYGGFSSLARVLRPRRHSHHQGEAGRRAAVAQAAAAEAAAAVVERERRENWKEVAAGTTKLHCLETERERADDTPDEEEGDAEAAGETAPAVRGDNAAASSSTSAYIGEEESNRVHRDAWAEAAVASPSAKRAVSAASFHSRLVGIAAAEDSIACAAAVSPFFGVAALPLSGRNPPRLLRDATKRVAGTRQTEAGRPSQTRGAADHKPKFQIGDSNSKVPVKNESNTESATVVKQQQRICSDEHQQQNNQRHGASRAIPPGAEQEHHHEALVSATVAKGARRSHTAPSRPGMNAERDAPPEAASERAAHLAGFASAVAAGRGVAAVNEARNAASTRSRILTAAIAEDGAAANFSVKAADALPALLHQQHHLANAACCHQQLNSGSNTFSKPHVQKIYQREDKEAKWQEGFGRNAAEGSAAAAPREVLEYMLPAQPPTGKHSVIADAGHIQHQQEQLKSSELIRLQQQLSALPAGAPFQQPQQATLQEHGLQYEQEHMVYPQQQQQQHTIVAQQQQQVLMYQQQQKQEKAYGETEAEQINAYGVQYDLQFGGVLVRLHRKLSAKCHCQFDVWEGEAVGFVQHQHETEKDNSTAALSRTGNSLREDGMAGVQQRSAGGSSSCSGVNERKESTSGGVGTAATAAKGGDMLSERKGDSKGGMLHKESDNTSILEDVSTLAALHASIMGLGHRFAIKILEVDSCDSSKLKYKTHSLLQEGKQLQDLCAQLWRSRAAAAIQELSMCPSSNTLRVAQQRLLLLQLQQEPRPVKHPEVYVQQLEQRGAHLPSLPIPRYFWTGWGVKREGGNRILGVSMEHIEGKSLTQILQQMRVPTKKSAALLTLEISIKFVRAQAVLSSHAALDKPIINWDTKPGNVLVELKRSPSTQKLHCLRCVIIDLGDALPGPTFSFPTRHQAGVTPSYVICTKGYCSPECAILVFMLSAGSKSSAFRKVWYGPHITAQKMLAAKKERFEKRWQDWIQQGYLKKVSLQHPPPSTTTSVHASSRLASASAVSVAGEKAASAVSATGGSGHTSVATAGGLGNNRRDEGTQEGHAKCASGREFYELQKGQQRINSTGGSGGSQNSTSYWEVLLSDRSVVFSTGLVIGQLFGGPSLLQVVDRDEIAALDILCEWECTFAKNLLLDRENLHSEALLPTQGVFAAEPWRDRVRVMLRHTLAFLPSERWSFQELENFLLALHQDLAATPVVTPVEAPAREGAVNNSNHHQNPLGHRQRCSPRPRTPDIYNHMQKNSTLRKTDFPQAAASAL